MRISPSGLLKALLVSLVLALSAYAVAKLNLFGLESASDQLADAVYQRVTAANYGADRKGQKAIRVVYLDDTSLQSLKGVGWTRFPPTFAQQWTMLDDLMQVGGAPPAAMYVDFIYMSEGAPGDGFGDLVSGVAAATHAAAWRDKPACFADPLIRIACIEAAGGTPILFAKPSPTDLAFLPDPERALDQIAVMTPALVGTTAYPLVTHYGLDRASAERLGVHGFDISPAMGLYAARCFRQADACGSAAFRSLLARARLALAGEALPVQIEPTAFDEPMDVVWGARPDPDYLALTRKVSGAPPPCRGLASGWTQRLLEQLADVRGPPSGARQECPYALSLGYDRIVAGTGLEQADLARVLAGRLVLVGGELHASNDWVESPVHGQTPGIQYHAMALDNLVEAGADYRRGGGGLLDSDLLKSLLLGALAFCGAVGVMARNSLLDRAVERGHGARLHPRVYAPLYAAIFGASIGLVLAITWLGVALAHHAPINWIGLSACVLGFLFYATRQTLPADVGASLEHIPLVRRVMAAGRACRSALKFEEERLVRHREPKPARPSHPRKRKVPAHAEI